MPTEPDLFRETFLGSTVGIALIETDRNGREHIIAANPALARITGFPEEELMDSAGLELLGLRGHERESEAMRITGFQRGSVEFEHTLRRPDGSVIWVLITLSPVSHPKGDGYRLAEVQDVTHRRDYQARLEFLAEHDSLTGLSNSNRLFRSIEKGLAYARRFGGDASLISFDLDRFKQVNDALGHTMGDEVLRRFGQILEERARETDTVARIGGDEFAVFLPGTGAAGAREVAESILGHLRSHPIEVDPGGIGSLTLSSSAGLTELGGRSEVEAKELLVEADAALYAAKKAGRNCAVDYAMGNDPSVVQLTRLTWAERTRRALDEDRFFLEAQPIRNIATGDLIAFEALLRMEDPEIGIAYPPEFLYTAERFGLSTRIDEWVLSEVISGLSQASSQDVAVSVNLTAASLDLSSGLPERIPEMLAEAGVDPARLSLEITEGACVNDIERTRLFVEKMGELGCRVALDDFGAGFGSFYYLKMLPVRILKLYGEFIRSLTTSSQDMVIARAITEMAHGLGIEVVAEFVSDQAINNACRSLGIDAIQGSYAGPDILLAEALSPARAG